MFFVSVADKGLSAAVSDLESTVTGGCVSVDSKGATLQQDSWTTEQSRSGSGPLGISFAGVCGRPTQKKRPKSRRATTRFPRKRIFRKEEFVKKELKKYRARLSKDPDDRG